MSIATAEAKSCDPSTHAHTHKTRTYMNVQCLVMH